MQITSTSRAVNHARVLSRIHSDDIRRQEDLVQSIASQYEQLARLFKPQITDILRQLDCVKECAL